MVFIISLFAGAVALLVWVIIGESLLYRVYNPSKIRPILNQYSGNRTMQMLRALSDGKIRPSDIRHYFNYGKSGSLSSTHDEFVLIKRLADRGECEIIVKHSGCDYSYLYEVKLDIKHGKAVITEYWHAA